MVGIPRVVVRAIVDYILLQRCDRAIVDYPKGFVSSFMLFITKLVIKNGNLWIPIAKLIICKTQS